ncbi:MAG TPA: DUF4331 domain-containing protein [Candidatus Dormibacteraeota bacterium]
MSSHREAPEIAKDPVADNTDLYAFVSPDQPDTVTLIANFIPLQDPAGGPNFYEFGDDVQYEINIDNNGDGDADVSYLFRFTTTVADGKTFLYNTGTITSLTDSTWNRRQHYQVTRVTSSGSKTLGRDLACPPCNVGPLSTPNYQGLASMAVHSLPGGRRVFAGQRAEGFYVDLGAIFDLGDLRPFQTLHIGPRPSASGVNATAGVNVHSIAIQVPKEDLTRGGYSGASASDPRSVIGVWAAAKRQRVNLHGDGASTPVGPWVQVSRLGNPLVNEVIIPMGEKDKWNGQAPNSEARYLSSYEHPELAGLLPVLYPDAFPNLKALDSKGSARADLVAILLTGLPAGVIPGFQNYTGKTQADMLRLNLAVAPSASPSLLGLLGNDAAGFPNGRRVFDDVTSIELRAVAGATYALIDKSYQPDPAASLIYDVTDPSKGTPASLAAIGMNYLDVFPYLGTPSDGFDTPSTTPTSSGV